MPNFNNGKIYKLTCSDKNKIYIGSTICSLSKRLGVHKYEFDTGTIKSSKAVFNIGNVEIHLLEKYPSKSNAQLRKREQYWINKYKNICVNNRRSYISDQERKEESAKYRTINRKILNTKKLEKIYCYYCDCYYTRSNKIQHYRTAKHQFGESYLGSA
jgi:hypothetical protein